MSSPSLRDWFDLAPFARSAGILSISSLANLVRGLVTAKVLAVALGPSPVGILSRLLNFSSLLITIGPLGLTIGVSKMTAEAELRDDRINRVVGTALTISAVAGSIMALV